MVYLVLFAVTTLLGWLAYRTVLSLKHRRVGHLWWAILGASLVASCTLGVWAGGFLQYQLTPRLRIVGVPIPVACFLLEQYANGEEQWTDFVSPVPTLNAAINLLFVVFFSVYLVWLANTLWRIARLGLTRQRIASLDSDHH